VKAILIAVVAIIIVTTAPCYAGSCIDMTGLPPLEAATVGQKPIRVVIEALLHDAETIYTEGAHLIAQKPRTRSPIAANTLSRDTAHNGATSSNPGYSRGSRSALGMIASTLSVDHGTDAVRFDRFTARLPSISSTTECPRDDVRTTFIHVERGRET
jgi:hypothetical protein